jgi:Txe/YoeB family toxin of Txe-Axe toxin-antitoxin module
MPVRKNIDYWKYSLENLEPEVDEEPYVHDRLIIENARYLAEVNNLRDLLTTYCVLSEIDKTNISFAQEEASAQTLDSDKHSEILKSARRKVLKEIDRLLRNIKNIQHTEFVAFFKCFGMSHSIYRKKADDEQRLVILETILERYCKRRKSQYDRLGYTHVIQQALYDSATSRTQGSSGIQKLRQLIERVSQDSGIPIQEIIRASQFAENSSKCSFYVVRTEKDFLELKKAIGFAYKYGQKKTKQNSRPDDLDK